jgi:hypothetical protein
VAGRLGRKLVRHDDVYVDYDDGYYLYNRTHPQERLVVTTVL